MDWSNVRSTIHCDLLYGCPLLHQAGNEFLDYHVDHMDTDMAVVTLKLVAQYGSAAAQSKCVKWIAANMSNVMR